MGSVTFFIMNPYLDGWFYIPKDVITNKAALINSLTITSKNLDSDGNLKIICVYKEDSNYIGVPYKYGVAALTAKYGKEYQYDDKSFAGVELKVQGLPDLYHPSAHKNQPELVEKMLKKLRISRTGLLTAPTGGGKTVMGLYIAGTLGVSTLIIVNKESLKTQWLAEIEKHLGIPKEDIGIIQGQKCNIKPITIAMLQTVYKGNYTKQIRDKFGMTIYDEVHNTGAEKFSAILGTVNSHYSLGMSATVNRKDNQDKAYKYFFGNSVVKSEGNALPIKVKVLKYNSNADNWGNDIRSKILCVTRDRYRNALIADLIIKAFDSNRNLVVFSNSTAQLIKLFEESVKKGLNPKVCGHFYLSNNNFIQGKKADYFKWIKEEAQIIFTTYGMMKEGISINRLDAAIEATPIMDAVQVLGRIRRPHEGKKMPIWFLIQDGDPVLSSMMKSKLKEIAKDASAKII